MLNALPDTLEDPDRMEDLGREVFCIGRVGETENIGVEDELRTDACAEGVAVDADDPGQRAAVWVKG